MGLQFHCGIENPRFGYISGTIGWYMLLMRRALVYYTETDGPECKSQVENTELMRAVNERYMDGYTPANWTAVEYL